MAGELWEWHQLVRIGAMEHGSWVIYGNGSCYQVTTGEDTADTEDLGLTAENCKQCESAIVL
jgi:hypothetical protein